MPLRDGNDLYTISSLEGWRGRADIFERFYRLNPTYVNVLWLFRAHRLL
jgi:hypothetical protein